MLSFFQIDMVIGEPNFAASLLPWHNLLFWFSFLGIYIMQNTMVGGGGWSLGKKIKNEELGEKIKKGKEKGRKIT